jgi:hypothetical protein
VTKTELKNKVKQAGDAIVVYKSENSKKSKYNILTLDLDNKYISSKKNKSKEDDNTVLFFCWDTDSYRLLKPEFVTNVIPLSVLLGNFNG